jgi:glutamate/tyrosine decarboxylase-like PLP-dependent enzyme
LPADVKEFSFPRAPAPLAEIYRDVAEKVMSYPMGNVHPRFWAWYMGSSNFTGALGDFLAAIQGSNLGGGNHAAAYMDLQVVDWCKEMVGLPVSASGTLVSGGSMANIIGLTVARNARRAMTCARVVAIEQFALLWLDQPTAVTARRWRRSGWEPACGAFRRMPNCGLTSPLCAAIAQDRAAGFQPACVIGTAGTVNTGAIDDLQGLARLAAEEDLWFHVDGCIGALIAVAPENAYRVAGIERADSVALDPHKWLHTPFEAGCALIRDAAAHRGLRSRRNIWR